MTHAITLRLQATLDLLKRYAAIFSHVWQQRKELDPPQRMLHEAQFLPAALELQETHVSHDAIADEKRGLIYSTRVRLQRATVRVEDKTVNLSAGMAVTVEIKTGKRRVIEYFLSPLLQYGSESLRER